MEKLVLFEGAIANSFLHFIDLMDREESWLNIIRDRLINDRKLLTSQCSLIDLLLSINKNLS
jgi:hypothetical protein